MICQIVVISGFATVWINVLVDDFGVFAFAKKYLMRYYSKDYQVLPPNWFIILKRPLFECEKCLAGQIALWYSVFNFNILIIKESLFFGHYFRFVWIDFSEVTHSIILITFSILMTKTWVKQLQD